MWFNESLLKTEALEKLIHNSRPGIEKELYEHLKTIYFDFGESEVLMTPTDANEIFLKKKQDLSYLTRIFRENMRAKPFENEEGKGIVKTYHIPYWFADSEGDIKRATYKLKGRPFVFKAEKILDKSDLKQWREIMEKGEVRDKQPDADQAPVEIIIPDGVEQDLPF